MTTSFSSLDSDALARAVEAHRFKVLQLLLLLFPPLPRVTRHEQSAPQTHTCPHLACSPSPQVLQLQRDVPSTVATKAAAGHTYEDGTSAPLLIWIPAVHCLCDCCSSCGKSSV